MPAVRKSRFNTGDVDSYIAAAPSRAQPMLRELRELVRREAPGAVERLSYGMPYYELQRRLLYFAALKTHIGVYGLVGAADAPASLEPYLAERGTLRFPFGQRLPISDLQSALRARVEQSQGAVRAAAVDPVSTEG